MTDIVDLANARRISDERDAELKALIPEMVEAGHVFADLINETRLAVDLERSNEEFVALCRKLVAAADRVDELSKAGFAAGHRRLT